MFLIMEKLIELLNNPEFEPSSKIERWTKISVQNCDYLIISKNRGFIQKLIENDCVDIEKFYSMTQNIEEIGRKINPPKIEVSLDNVKDPLLEFEKTKEKISCGMVDHVSCNTRGTNSCFNFNIEINHATNKIGL